MVERVGLRVNRAEKKLSERFADEIRQALLDTKTLQGLYVEILRAAHYAALRMTIFVLLLSNNNWRGDWRGQTEVDRDDFALT